MSAVRTPSPQEAQRDRETVEKARADQKFAQVEADIKASLESNRARNRPPDLDLDAIEADAKTRLVTLREQRQRLSPAALTDGTVAAEVDSIESEIASAQATLERIPLARLEAVRREEEAKRLAKVRRPHLDEARRLAVKREEAALAVDAAAKVYAESLRVWDRLTTEQEAVLRRAGRDGRAARPRRWAIEAGLMRALIDAGCPRGIVRLETFMGENPTFRPSAVKPLSELDGPIGQCQLGEGS
jgi:hypothetical protein